MSEAENKMLISRMLAGEVDWLEQRASERRCGVLQIKSR